LINAIVFDLAESAHAVDLVRRELGKHVLVAGFKHIVAARLETGGSRVGEVVHPMRLS
jgi:hypothetical protein